MKTISTPRKIFAALTTTALLVFAPCLAVGQETTWTGNTGASWLTAGNWTDGVPGSATNTTIIQGTNTAATGAVIHEVGDLNLTSTGGNLFVTLNVTVNSVGGIQSNGNIVIGGAGSLTPRGGGDLIGSNLTINLEANFGSANSTGANASIGNLTISNSTSISAVTSFAVIGGAVNLGALTLNSTLNMTNGNSSDNGTLTGGTNLITVSSLAGSASGTIQANKASTTGHLTINGSSSTSYAGTIVDGAGTVRLTKSGTGTQTLTGVNTYTGSTTISNGTLLLSGTGSLNGTSGVTVNSGGTFSYGSSAGLTRNITLNTGGTFAHNGSSAYTGALTWNGGTLAGTNFSGVSLTVGANKTLSPGNSPGTMASAGQTWLDGGNYNLQIFDVDLAAGTGFDTIEITGSLSLGGLTAGGFNINLWSLSAIGPDANGDAIGFNPFASGSWMIVSTTTGISGFDEANFTINMGAINGTAGFSNALEGGAFSVSSDGSDLYLNFTAVPEPSAMVLLTLGLCAVTIFRRRRLQA